MQQEEGVLDSRYSVISQARYNAKSFGDGEYEQIDIKSYLEECGKSDTELGKVLRSAVKYSGSSSYNSNGLATVSYTHLKFRVCVGGITADIL